MSAQFLVSLERCWPIDSDASEQAALHSYTRNDVGPGQAFAAVWDSLRVTWALPAELLLSRLLQMRRWQEVLNGPDSELYKPELRRKSAEVLARLGHIEPHASSLFSAPELEFLKWVVWWESGDSAPGTPVLADSVFGPYCTRLLERDFDGLYKSLKRSIRKDERVSLLREWAARELCETLLTSGEYKRCQVIAEDAKLYGYFAFAAHARQPDESTRQALRYRRYRIERLQAQLEILGIPAGRRWTREIARLAAVTPESTEIVSVQEVPS